MCYRQDTDRTIYRISHCKAKGKEKDKSDQVAVMAQYIWSKYIYLIYIKKDIA